MASCRWGQAACRFAGRLQGGLPHPDIVLFFNVSWIFIVFYLPYEITNLWLFGYGIGLSDAPHPTIADMPLKKSHSSLIYFPEMRFMGAQLKPADQRTGQIWILRTLSTIIILSGLWWVITNGSVASWFIGLPVIATATWASRRLSRLSGTQISLSGLARFVPFFLWESLRGGVDVALRTLTPRMRIAPGFSRYRTGLKTSSARTLFVNCVSLLPGTLAVDLQDEWLEIHMLDIQLDPNATFARLERVVARLFANTGD